MPDLTPERKQEIKELIRKRTAEFANLKAKPSTISGRELFGQAMSRLFTGQGFPGIHGMRTIRRTKLETEEEQDFFDKVLSKQREESNVKLQKVLNALQQ